MASPAFNNAYAEESELASAWDRAADDLEVDPMRQHRYNRCFRYLTPLPRTSCIVEIGCGEGTGLLTLRDRGYSNLVGVEVSAERLHRANERLKGQVDLRVVSPSGPLPFADQSVDAVVTAAVIEHTVDQQAFVAELARVVRPGGYVIISSDCFSWRVLQWLGVYHSVQPLDKALLPSTLCHYFSMSGLRLVHCEGFHLPGLEYRFIRSILEAVASVAYRTVQRRAPWLVKWLARRRVSHALDNQDLPRNAVPTVDSAWPILERAPRSFVARMKLLMSDENVFCLIKQ